MCRSATAVRRGGRRLPPTMALPIHPPRASRSRRDPGKIAGSRRRKAESFEWGAEIAKARVAFVAYQKEQPTPAPRAWRKFQNPFSGGWPGLQRSPLFQNQDGPAINATGASLRCSPGHPVMVLKLPRRRKSRPCHDRFSPLVADFI